MVSRRVNNKAACSTTAPTRRVERSYSDADWQKVAETLASGYSQNRTAQLTGVPQPTIWNRYNRDPEFRKLVADLTARFVSSGDSVHEQTAALARLLVHQAMCGERDRDDPVVQLAFDYLRETEYPLRRGQYHKQFGQL